MLHYEHTVLENVEACSTCPVQWFKNRKFNSAHQKFAAVN
jgi:hypothetical protein